MEALRREDMNPTAAIFNKNISSDDRLGLLAISPEDIAKSEKPKWLYAIRRGWVYEVASFAEAKQIISGG